MIRDDETINTEPMLGIACIAIVAIFTTGYLVYQYYQSSMYLLALASGN